MKRSQPPIGPSTLRALATEFKSRARDQGLDLVGITEAEPSRQAQFFSSWVQAGYHGGMAYLGDPESMARRADLRRTSAAVKSVIVVAQDYGRDDPPGNPQDPARAVIARYARGEDYHTVLGEKLQGLAGWLDARANSPTNGQTKSYEVGGGAPSSPPAGPSEGEVRTSYDSLRYGPTKVYVDTGPILERELANRAGLGWFGKNTMLLNPRRGSFFFLGVLLTEIPLPPDLPFQEDHCGSCTRCLEACPTDALLGRDESGAPVIDATRCISYLTIEHRGSIPLDLRPGLGNRVFGCDICQEVCPWNEKFAPSAFDSAYLPREDLSGASLIDLADRLLEMSEKRYQREFSDSPLSRPRRKGMLRSLCVALGNWGRAEAIPTLERALEDSQPLVREHAAWALDRIRSHPSNKRQQ